MVVLYRFWSSILIPEIYTVLHNEALPLPRVTRVLTGFEPRTLVFRPSGALSNCGLFFVPQFQYF